MKIKCNIRISCNKEIFCDDHINFAHDNFLMDFLLHVEDRENSMDRSFLEFLGIQKFR
jgi:hypothetical protein